MSASLHDSRTAGAPRIEEVGDGIFAYIQPDGTWWINNTGFLVGTGGVISVDTCATERRTRDYLAAIRSVSALPIRTLINTHHHGDHTNGNFLFDGATIVAHESCRTEVIATGQPSYEGIWNSIPWGNLSLAPPFLTYGDRVTVWVDELQCDLRHVGTPAHTTNDSILWIPDRSILFSGDLLFNGGSPFLLMGSVSGAVDAVESLKALSPRTIVPGHGDVCGPEVIDTVLGYLRRVQEIAMTGKAANQSPLEAARACDLGEFAELRDVERIVGNLHRAYAELDGQPRGARIDLRAALADMVTYNGGRPLTCLA
ncbi:MAG TPA: MBL fold metallo-hydrolase [Candidatus Acidoferrales bacterium]|nr:MBL fold metallo-hydrolase [Candidatus Acidoferrales bacterium]